jgi:diaminopimelate decarboxylase
MGEGVLNGAPAAVGGVMHCEAVPLDRLAAAVGTPTYVYSTATIRERYSALERALASVPHRIHYACKANGSLALLALLKRLGARVDVVSAGELYRATSAGFSAEDVVFGGVGKTEEELDRALAAGVHLISVESADELRLIDALARRRGLRPRIGIRVNPEITVESFHDYIKTGESGDKFGVPLDVADEVARVASRMPNVVLAAVGMHIGSQVSELSAFVAGLDRLETLVRGLHGAGVETLEALDVGGGLFVPYGDEPPVDLDAYARAVTPVARRLGLMLIVEPGRFLVAEAGALLTRVLYRKRSGGRLVLVTDAGMNDLLRPSHYDAYHRIAAVAPTGRTETFDVVGPICESGDFLAIERELDDVGPGALLCVQTAGAYGYSMASNYNARPRPAEVLVDGARWAVITARETLEDLVRRETVSPSWRTT